MAWEIEYTAILLPFKKTEINVDNPIHRIKPVRWSAVCDGSVRASIGGTEAEAVWVRLRGVPGFPASPALASCSRPRVSCVAWVETRVGSVFSHCVKSEKKSETITEMMKN